mmetsp:Transcript_34774/g.97582  ORF Transcript_34774/g.97582 Transcript_34774/m.97582 type:complete len:225 (-) Transcript_34774:263-937(-)
MLRGTARPRRGPERPVNRRPHRRKCEDWLGRRREAPRRGGGVLGAPGPGRHGDAHDRPGPEARVRLDTRRRDPHRPRHHPQVHGQVGAHHPGRAGCRAIGAWGEDEAGCATASAREAAGAAQTAGPRGRGGARRGGGARKDAVLRVRLEGHDRPREGGPCPEDWAPGLLDVRRGEAARAPGRAGARAGSRRRGAAPARRRSAGDLRRVRHGRRHAGGRHGGPVL